MTMLKRISANVPIIGRPQDNFAGVAYRLTAGSNENGECGAFAGKKALWKWVGLFKIL